MSEKKNNFLIQSSSTFLQAVWFFGMGSLLIGASNIIRIFILTEGSSFNYLLMLIPVVIGFVFLSIPAYNHPKGFVWAFASSVIIAIYILSSLLIVLGIFLIISSKGLSMKAWVITSINIPLFLLCRFSLKERGIYIKGDQKWDNQ